MQRLTAETKILGPLPQAHAHVHTPAGDPNFAGVKWHVDLNGNEFPFSRGCSFYEVGLFGVEHSSCSAGMLPTLLDDNTGHCRELPAALAITLAAETAVHCPSWSLRITAICCMLQLNSTLSVPAGFTPSLMFYVYNSTVQKLFLCAGE